MGKLRFGWERKVNGTGLLVAFIFSLQVVQFHRMKITSSLQKAERPPFYAKKQTIAKPDLNLPVGDAGCQKHIRQYAR
jgi:hypothetical protein